MKPQIKHSITVREFENRVKQLEGILIVVRAPTNTLVADYDYIVMTKNNATVNSFIENRIKSKIKYDIEIIDGALHSPQLTSSMKSLRATYSNGIPFSDPVEPSVDATLPNIRKTKSGNIVNINIT